MKFAACCFLGAVTWLSVIFTSGNPDNIRLTRWFVFPPVFYIEVSFRLSPALKRVESLKTSSRRIQKDFVPQVHGIYFLFLSCFLFSRPPNLELSSGFISSKSSNMAPGEKKTKNNKLRWYPQQPQHFIFTNLSDACCEAKRWKHLS